MHHVLPLAYKTNFSLLQNFLEVSVSEESKQDISAAEKEEVVRMAGRL